MASGKVTGVHIGMIICAVLMLIFMVSTFLMYKSFDEQSADLATAKAEADSSKAVSRNYLDQITALKSTLGATLDNVGTVNAQDPNTVIGFTNAKMQEFGGSFAQATVVETLARMREEINVNERLIADLESSKTQLNTEKVNLQNVYTAKENVHDKAREDSEKEKVNLISLKKEEVDSVRNQLLAEQQKNSQLQIDFEKMQEQLNLRIDDLDGQVSKLTGTNESLTAELNNLRDESFDIADGRVTSVVFDTNSVYIDLGSDQKLKPGTTFSVYNKDISNVGGRTSDIKASIMVTEILGPQSAIATITSEGDFEGDYSRPIARGDAIYSPLWRAGLKETFAFVGKFDIDQDKIDDRKILITAVQNAGGVVGDEILPSGERTGEEITSDYKFVVLGDIGEPLKEPDPQKRAAIQRVHSLANDIKKEAQQSGVRVITMNDFLSYMGYKTQRRLWRPGENIPWIMTTRRDGGRSRSDNVSRGTTSGAYSGSNRNVESPR
ncbi:MAG: hypothetical protein P8M30_13170 [Planctomycetaceae bacterium]|jgi:hypothetical protein|nr:hypothetical protein [Planctomycetaceae bacterium]